jgi:hypothetical protein
VGALNEVDLVNRTIHVLVGPTRLTFDVPPVCEIMLNGERVKLHVLQARDTVAVVHGPEAGDCAAKRIEVVNHAPRQRRMASAGVA